MSTVDNSEIAKEGDLVRLGPGDVVFTVDPFNGCGFTVLLEEYDFGIVTQKNACRFGVEWEVIMNNQIFYVRDLLEKFLGERK